MQNLKNTYFEIQQVLGINTEPWESVELVERYRRYFKPDNVRVVLLAESHVFTHNADREITIQPIPELPGYPTTYVRFVYCLAYGERSLTNDPLHPNRDGTPQFWKLFFSCANPIHDRDDFRPILSYTPESQRILNKSNLLKRMKEMGIWLVDASIVALYNKGKKIPKMSAALKISWESHTREVVLASNPEHVVCVGKGVARVVEGDLRRHFDGRYTIIPQPNAFLSSEEHMENYKMYHRICCG